MSNAPQLGRKWFVFYAKVRPWIACFFLLPTITGFAEYSYIYFSNWWMLLSFAAAVTGVVLGIMVFVKSRGDYVEFVRFVKKVLLFETFNMAYQESVKNYINTSFNVGSAFGTFIILLVFIYFIWYRLNKKYFEKRVNSVS